MSAAARPAQLQANLAGAWKTVLHFDAADEAAAEKVRDGASLLFEAAPSSRWRTATQGRLPVVLSHMGASTYGIWMACQQE